MKFRNAMYAWTPLSWPATGSKAGTIGMVKVGPHPDTTGWSEPYSHSAGSCYLALKNDPEIVQVAQLFIDFHTMIVRDGIDPRAAHREFLKIDEYRERISRDIPGAEDAA